MHGPVDGEVSRSSSIPPSIAATVARPAGPPDFSGDRFDVGAGTTPRSSLMRRSGRYHGGVRPRYWLPPALWMAVIMGLSSDAGSAEHTGHWLLPILKALAPWATPAQLGALHGLVRKAGHLTEYAILAALWFRAVRRGLARSPRAAAWFAIGTSLAWALLDEALQSMRPSRTGSGTDVAIDATGALLGLTFARFGWRGAADRTTTTLLWLALLGGAILLVVNALAGVPSGLLWLTAPAAALLLLLRRIYARSMPARPTPPP